MEDINVLDTKVKRVTANFQRLLNFDGSSINEWKKWREEQAAKGVKMAYDRRNNIYCIGPSMDYEMYYNYLNYLNECYSDWYGYGYFDAGLVPYLMWPSFMDNSPVMEQMRSVARVAGITLISVPAISFLREHYPASTVDYWVTREDLYSLAMFMQNASDDYHFDFNGPDDVSLCKFIKPLADISRAVRRPSNESSGNE